MANAWVINQAALYTDRRYKGTTVLGSKLNLGKICHDRVQSANLTLWK
ncbi:outer membrane protein [Mannheimia varigena USDA-ARS-USMARC-1388]|nr:hypothetical protein [Mannheimia varigena]AHG79678.1 outer membrane protein [Mannheimia varigena USDA-ARS-USMARC-1388]